MKLTKEDLDFCQQELKANPQLVFLLPRFRRFYAIKRFEQYGKVRTLNSQSDGKIAKRTIDHNLSEIIRAENKFATTTRPGRLISALASLSPVFESAKYLKVLLIGPRTEMEIYCLLSVGFDLRNISAIDLISSSPLIELGDMHALRFSDSEFDVVISAWVINYSHDPEKALAEYSRVLKKGGLLAIGSTADSDHTVIRSAAGDVPGDIAGCSFATTEDIMLRIPKIYDFKICLSQDSCEDTNRRVLLITRKNK